jgi:hypothetical protein
VHRARQRHVDQAHRLGGGLQRLLLLQLLELLLVELAQVDHGFAVVLVLQAFAAAARALLAVPQQRAEDHRVLQPLGLVDRHHLHKVAVGFQAQLRRVVPACLAALGLQPALQRLGRRVGIGGLVQAFGKVQQVGQAPFAVGPGQQPAAHAFGLHPLAQHQAHAALRPGVAIAGEARDQVQQRRFVGRQGLDGRGVQAHRFGSQRGAQQRLALRLQHAASSRSRSAASALSKTLACDSSTLPHAHCRQRAAHCRTLRMAAHQHGDVAGGQRPIAQPDLAVAGGCQQPRDLAGASFVGQAHRLGTQQRLSVAVARQLPQLQRGSRRPRAFDQRRSRLGAHAHQPVVQAVLHEAACYPNSAFSACSSSRVERWFSASVYSPSASPRACR